MIMKYLHSRRSCKPSVPVQETTAEKRSFSTHFFISAQSSRSSSTIRVLFIFQFLSPLCSSINRFFRCFGDQPHPTDPHPESNRHPSMNAGLLVHLSNISFSLSLALRLLSAGESKPALLSRWFYASSYRSGHLFHLFPFLFPLCLRQGSRFQILNTWFGERISLVDLCLTIKVVDVRISADKFIYSLHNFAVSRIECCILFLGVKIDDGLLFISW